MYAFILTDEYRMPLCMGMQMTCMVHMLSWPCTCFWMALQWSGCRQHRILMLHPLLLESKVARGLDRGGSESDVARLAKYLDGFQ